MDESEILIAFDLDDTLCKEVEFVRSAYRHISNLLNDKYGIASNDSYATLFDAFRCGENPFDTLLYKYPVITETALELVEIYRYHTPTITLEDSTKELLEHFKTEGYALALITDGRSITQRNKIIALGLDNYFDDENIIISEEFGSEKTDIRNFLYFNDSYTTLYYIGDNPRKDFINPNILNWRTIMLRNNGENIHSQQIEVTDNHHAQHSINTLSELLNIIPLHTL